MDRARREWGTLLSAAKLPNRISTVIRKLLPSPRVFAQTSFASPGTSGYRRPLIQEKARVLAFIKPYTSPV